MVRPFVACSLSALLVFTSVACSGTSSDGGSSSGGSGTGGDGSSSAGTSGSTSSSDAPASCGKAGRTGVTECKRHNTTCNAGTYCNTDVGKSCILGCTSDAECGESDHCVKCSDEFGAMDVGTCQPCSVTKEEACKGSPTDTPSTCQRTTQRDAPICQGKKAYDCPPGEEPAGDCSVGADGMTYCCN